MNVGYYSQKKQIVEHFVESIKKRKLLPFKIRINKCPSRKKSCSKHHGEIIISSFDKKTQKFHLKYFGTHEKGIQFQYDQPAKFVIELILKQIQSRKRLITTNQLKKFSKLDLDKSIFRKNQINLHFSDAEFNNISKKASKKNLSVYDYSRSKLLA